MKRTLKQYEKYLSLRHYITVLRRQPEHIRHLYAGFFAGMITLLLAASILYFDYGFWHDTYFRSDIVEVEKKDTGAEEAKVQSPQDMLGDFFKEAVEKLDRISISSTTLPTGKDTYKRE